jgi:hypothetical protein
MGRVGRGGVAADEHEEDEEYRAGRPHVAMDDLAAWKIYAATTTP